MQKLPAHVQKVTFYFYKPSKEYPCRDTIPLKSQFAPVVSGQYPFFVWFDWNSSLITSVGLNSRVGGLILPGTVGSSSGPYLKS